MDAILQSVLLLLLLPRPTLPELALLGVLLFTVVVLTRDNEPP